MFPVDWGRRLVTDGNIGHDARTEVGEFKIPHGLRAKIETEAEMRMDTAPTNADGARRFAAWAWRGRWRRWITVVDVALALRY